MKNKFKIVVGAGIIAFSIIISKTNEVSCMQKYDFENLRINNSQLLENSLNKKTAYITIDDGPSKNTDKIIEILDKYNAKATFFMIDKNMKAHPQQVKNIVESGNSSGFHSVSHDIHKLYRKETSAKEEFDINKETFFEITGKESNIVRLPYGSKPYTPEKSYEKLVKSGYKLWDWNIDTLDWKSNSQQIIENVKNQIKNQNEVVILMHEKDQTVKALDQILSYLKKEGYEIKAIDEELIPTNFWNINKHE